jgi:hypothetical protein
MLAVGSTASASITQIQSGGQGGSEPSVWNVLNALLGPGASLTQADVNGGGVELGGHTGLSRVSDSTDQFYRDGSAPVSVLGLFFDNPDIGEPFGGDAHDLFFENESSGAAAVQVTDGQSVLGQIDVNIGEIYSLTAVRGSLPFDGSQDNTSRQIASSIDSENIASGDTTIDRMVTFSIDIDDIPTLTALDGTTIDLSGMQGPASSGVAYVHFFDTGSDADYQDAVYLTIGATAVPTPGAIALFVAAGGYVTRRRRR